jgi:hypothetical protein
MSDQLYEEITIDNRAEQLCNELIGALMRKKIYCDLDDQTATFLDQELINVKEMHQRFMAGDILAREHILAKYPAEILSYTNINN